MFKLFARSAKPAADAPEAKDARDVAEAAEAAGAPKKRSKLMLAVLATVPLVLAGGGYAGWTLFLANPDGAGEETARAEAEQHAPDPVVVAALPTELAAESSYTHSFALSVLIREKCGGRRAPALKAASEEEARADGLLVQMSWVSAARRATALSDKSCGYLLGEVAKADEKAAMVAEAKLAAAKKAAEAGH